MKGDDRVAMVGDGTNDAPALAAADLGSLGSGTALAADAADVAIVDDDLASVERAFALARAARNRIRQNLGLAFVYNAIAIPPAVLGIVNPLVTTVAVVVGPPHRRQRGSDRSSATDRPRPPFLLDALLSPRARPTKRFDRRGSKRLAAHRDRGPRTGRIWTRVRARLNGVLRPRARESCTTANLNPREARPVIAIAVDEHRHPRVVRIFRTRRRSRVAFGFVDRRDDSDGGSVVSAP